MVGEVQYRARGLIEAELYLYFYFLALWNNGFMNFYALRDDQDENTEDGPVTKLSFRCKRFPPSTGEEMSEYYRKCTNAASSLQHHNSDQ